MSDVMRSFLLRHTAPSATIIETGSA